MTISHLARLDLGAALQQHARARDVDDAKFKAPREPDRAEPGNISALDAGRARADIEFSPPDRRGLLGSNRYERFAGREIQLLEGALPRIAEGDPGAVAGRVHRSARLEAAPHDGSIAGDAFGFFPELDLNRFARPQDPHR
jgi:hypothetical protein